MQNSLLPAKISRLSATFLLATMLAVLAGCTGGTRSAAPGTTTTTPAPSMTITLTDPTSGATTTSTPAIAKVTVKDAAGNLIANTAVTFEVADPTVATLTPSNGTALTNEFGVASITLNAASNTAAGTTTITATAQVGTTAVTASKDFAVNITVVTITAPIFDVNPLSAYGTTNMTVTVTPSATPLTVTFTSLCASSGKAVLSASVTTVAGVATGTYWDNGCAGTDTITATVSGMASASSTLVVTAPAAGSLQFVSATPAIISLKGTGGIETSQVVFKVVDSGGKGLSGKTVTFSLSTAVGGITLTGGVATAISDSTGSVTITVNAGTVSTPVRVTASTPGATANTTLTTQSNQLTITTGIPDQDSFSLSATKLNMEGWNVNGNTSVVTVYLADHFNNPVPDGTVVNFTTEGGSIIGSCTTIGTTTGRNPDNTPPTTNGGYCESIFTSQNLRPTNGRVTILAYALGEESFTDLNGNGVADLAPVNEMKDANGDSTDMPPEVYVDYNENTIRDDTTEPFIDFNMDGIFNTAPDGKFNGVLCSTLSSAGTCSTTKAIYVRRSMVITMSSSSPSPLALFDPLGVAATSISLPSCSNPVAPTTTTTASGPVTTYNIRVVDVNGNAMPVGTTIAFTSSNGTLLSPASVIVPNTSGCSSAFAGCPAGVGTAAFGIYSVTMQSDATYVPATDTVPAKCTNAKNEGILTVTVTSPGGLITTVSFAVTD